MGKSIKSSSIGVALLLLCSCSRINTERALIPDNFSLYESEAGYKIAVPLGYTYAELAPSGKYYYYGYPDTNPRGMSSIEFYPESLPCTPSLTGVSQSTSLPNTGEKTEWGKVDFFDIYGMDYDPESEPKCRPPVDGAAYVLCSEKDGKTVLICISQATDNPALAEEIFKTFRWIDK